MSINVGTAIGYLDLDTSGWTRGLNTARAGMRQFLNQEETLTNRLNGLGTTMASTGRFLTPITVGLAGIGTAAVKMASDFSSSMAKVAAISGASEDDLEKLNEKARELGETTIFSASEVADGFSYMAMAGWKTEDMLDGIQGMLDLAASSGEDLARTSDIVTDALTAFGLTAKDTQEFVDVLASAASNSNTNVGMMGYTFKYAAPLAGALGYSIQDVAVAAGLMANAGIKAETAGTSLRTIFSELNGVIELTGENLGDYVIEIEHADGSIAPLGETIASLRDAFSQMTEAEKVSNAEALVGKEAMSGLLAIVNASESDFNKLTDAINNSSGSAASMADIMQDNLGGDLKALSSALEGAGITIGDVLIPSVRQGIQFITKLISVFNELDPETQELIVKIAALAAAAAPTLLIGSKALTLAPKLVSSISAFFPVILNLIKLIGSIANPVTAVIAVLGLMYAAYKSNLGGIKDVVDNNIAALIKAWDDFIDFAPQIPEMFIAGLVGGLKSGAGAVVEAVKALGEDMYKGLMKAIDAHSPSKKAALIGGYWDMGLAQGIITNSNVTMDAMSYLSRLIQNSGESLRDTFVSIGEGMNSKLYSGIYNNSMRIISVYESERNKRVSLMTQGTQENLNQIQRELNATQQAYQIKMQLYQQEYNARVAMVDEAVSDEVASIQAQIDAIDEAAERERRSEEEANYQERLAAKEEELKLAKNEQELAEIQAEMDELIYARQKQLLAQQRADEQKALREQIQEAYARANERKAALQEEFEAKQLQLQQQRDAEIEFMTQLQELLKEDLELRKELAETQKEISTREEKLKTGNLKKEVETQTRNEIQELRKRESEIKLSMDKNRITFESFTPKLQKIGNDYGTVLKNGIMQYEGVISNFLSGLLRQANNVIDAMREAASMAGAAETAVASYNSQAARTPAYSSGGNTYNFYSNEAMTPTEISRQFKKTEQDLALGF